MKHQTTLPQTLSPFRHAPRAHLRARPLALALLLALPALARAQTDAESASESAPTLSTISVSASPLGLSGADMSTPVTVLADDELVRRRGATLGDTLAAEPGMAASSFGAGAARPVIRGLDGPRVKVLADGAEVQDASTISPDHAVAAEPLLTERIEVLRGPATLLYGGGAIGGVVNLIDRRIPTEAPENGYAGEAELRAGSAAHERTGLIGLTAGRGPLVLRVEGLSRDQGDYAAGSGFPGGDKVADSFLRSQTGSLGLSWVGERGYLGLAYTSQRSRYGLPGHEHGIGDCHLHGSHLHCGDHGEAEEDGHDEHAHEDAAGHAPYSRLESERVELRGELREPFAGFSRARLRAALTDYQHQEIEGEVVGTTFKNHAFDSRLELEHHPVAGWRGVLGVQTTRRDFSAMGEEAYVPRSLTQGHALFALEEYRLRDWRFELGLRHERQRIDVASDQPDTRHNGTSASASASWQFAPGHSLGLSLARAQRLPSAEELYANGPHAATLTYELGNPALKKETAHNLELSLKKHTGATTFELGAFHNRVDGFIHARTLDQQDDVRLIEYAQRDATFTGLEGKIRRQLDSRFGLTLFGDLVQARFDGRDEATGQNDRLPRMPARRAGLRLDGRWQAWSGELEWYRVARQTRIAAFESETPGYNMLNLSLAYSGSSSLGALGAGDWQVYLRADNLTDELAYNAVSFIKDAAPLPGRNLTLGLRVSF